MYFGLTDRYQKFTMTTYIPALVWLLSGVVCIIIAKRRQVKKTALRTMLVALLGPMAIPWVLVTKSDEVKQA